jgi:hypothetical protein
MSGGFVCSALDDDDPLQLSSTTRKTPPPPYQVQLILSVTKNVVSWLMW